MGVKFVQSDQVTNVNGENFAWPANPDGTPMQIPCENTEIIGSYWRIPQVIGGRVAGYQTQVDNGTSTKPTPDAIKILRVKLTDTAGITQVDMAIADTDNVPTSSPVNQFAYLCNGTGGTLPVMPTITIPVPIQQNTPQVTNNSNGDNTFYFPFPDNPNGLEYNVQGAWFNGIDAVPAFDPSGLTTVADVATWANSNWSDYGTWSNPGGGNILQLVSTTSETPQVAAAGIVVDLTADTFCFNITAYSTPTNVNGIKFGSGGIIPITAFLLTNNNVSLMNNIQKYFDSGAVFNTGTSHKLGVTTVLGTPALYNDTTLVVTAGAGAC